MTHHLAFMQRAIALSENSLGRTAPNPIVGAVIVAADGSVIAEGFHDRQTSADHAEVVALKIAGDKARGATMYVTLEPCNHTGRTGPCTEAIIEARIARVVVGIEDPDDKVRGTGIARLRAAGIDVTIGGCESDVAHQLRAYVHHRRTGRPYVVAKMAMTIDGRVTSPSPSERWLTGVPARTRVHELRAESDAIVVGAGTVRTDNPSLTTRLVDGPSPRRIVLGKVSADAKVHPCLEWDQPLPELLDTLGAECVLQLMVEGGPTVAASFHRENLINQYVMYIAPAFMGGNDGTALFMGQGAGSINEMWRGTISSVRMVGDDIEIVVDNNSR